MSGASGYVPFLPPIWPYVLPEAPFDALLAQYGINLTWQKSHLCACVWGGREPGTADPRCSTCGGLGYYWDTPPVPFAGLITYVHMSPSPDEPGAIIDPSAGLVLRSEPTITIPAPAPSGMWAAAGPFDLITELAATQRLNVSVLQGSRGNLLPYPNSSVAPTGAVTVYDTGTSAVVNVTGYVVSGNAVFLPSGYAAGTPFTVETTVTKAYLLFRQAGAQAHARPFGNSMAQSLPRRFRGQEMDLWLRGRLPGTG